MESKTINRKFGASVLGANGRSLVELVAVPLEYDSKALVKPRKTMRNGAMAQLIGTPDSIRGAEGLKVCQMTVLSQTDDEAHVFCAISKHTGGFKFLLANCADTNVKAFLFPQTGERQVANDQGRPGDLLELDADIRATLSDGDCQERVAAVRAGRGDGTAHYRLRLVGVQGKVTTEQNEHRHVLPRNYFCDRWNKWGHSCGPNGCEEIGGYDEPDCAQTDRFVPLCADLGRAHAAKVKDSGPLVGRAVRDLSGEWDYTNSMMRHIHVAIMHDEMYEHTLRTLTEEYAALKLEQERALPARIFNTLDACCICMDAKPVVVLETCMHVPICPDCYRRYNTTCPLCRSSVVVGRNFDTWMIV